MSIGDTGSAAAAHGPAANQAAATRPIRPRTLSLPIDSQIPRHWVGKNSLATALANSVNMLFPAGERFFVRSVHHYLPLLPEELRNRVHGFCGQEGRHAQAHEKVNRVLAEQGFRVESFLRFYERVCYGFTERISPPQLRLAATAACEHFTAIMADNFMRQKEFLSFIDPTMRELLLWHAAEEIEHKSVAFDVLSAVAPSYRLRVLGMAIASSFLGLFWFTGTVMLLTQERQKIGLSGILADARRLGAIRRQTRRRGIIVEVFLRGIREYLRRDFHPDSNDNYALAQSYLQAAGLA